MATRYVGAGGDDGNSGLTWALRRLTLNGCEDSPVAAGDVCYIGPGVYRELLTCDVSGGNTYSTGTISLTNGSKTVTGSGTAFTGNVYVTAGYFHVLRVASGTDGVTAGDNTFASAGGNFQAGHVGMVIQINTKQSYVIASVVDANNITLSYPHAATPVWPSEGSGLTYSVMSGQGAYAIASVDNNTQLTLVNPWVGPTLSGLAYLAFQAIEYIADVTGVNTDGVGGEVRITGSDDDQSATRANCFNIATRSYRVFRGFRLDTTTGPLIPVTTGSYPIIEDCFGGATNISQYGFYYNGAGVAATIRRSIFVSQNYFAVCLANATDLDDTGDVVENCISGAEAYGNSVNVQNRGGVTLKNLLPWATKGLRVQASPTVGQTVVVANCIIEGLATGLEANTLGDMVENYNTFFGNNTNRTNVGTGAGSVAYPALFQSPMFLRGFQFPWQFGALSAWSQVRGKAGWAQYAVGDDLHGIARPVTEAKKSWGPVQYVDDSWSSAQAQAGTYSRRLADAGEKQVRIARTAAESTTISIYVYREADYAGTLPQMVIRQPGVADRTTTDTGAASQWNKLTDTFTPAASPPYVVIFVRSNNTAVAGDYGVYYDTAKVD